MRYIEKTMTRPEFLQCRIDNPTIERAAWYGMYVERARNYRLRARFAKIDGDLVVAARYRADARHAARQARNELHFLRREV